MINVRPNRFLLPDTNVMYSMYHIDYRSILLPRFCWSTLPYLKKNNWQKVKSDFFSDGVTDCWNLRNIMVSFYFNYCILCAVHYKISHNLSNTAIKTMKNRCLERESNSHLRVSRPPPIEVLSQQGLVMSLFHLSAQNIFAMAYITNYHQCYFY